MTSSTGLWRFVWYLGFDRLYFGRFAAVFDMSIGDSISLVYGSRRKCGEGPFASLVFLQIRNNSESWKAVEHLIFTHKCRWKWQVCSASITGNSNKRCSVGWEEVLKTKKNDKPMRSNDIRQGAPQLCSAFIRDLWVIGVWFFDHSVGGATCMFIH